MLAALFLVGSLVSTQGFPLGGIVVAPLFAAVFAAALPTGAVSAAALAVAFARPTQTNEFWTAAYNARIVSVALGGALAVVLARIRSRHEAEISASSDVVALADALGGTVARLDTLLARSPAAFAFFDLDGTITRVNETFATLFGYTSEAITGQSIAEAMPNIWDRVRPLFEHVVQSGEPIIDLEVTGRSASDPGVERFWLASMFAVRGNAAGATDGTFGVGALVLDITERKRAEQHTQLLAAASNLFAVDDLTLDDAIARAARLAIPTFADACVVSLPTRAGGGRRATVAHRDEEVEASLRELIAHIPAPSEDGPIARTLRGGGAEFIQRVGDEHRRARNIDPAHRAYYGALAATSVIVAPLAIGDRVIGAITLLHTTHSNREYRPGDVDVALELGRRIAQVLESVRLADEAARATARLELLARVGELLTIELDVGQRLQRVARLTLPEFADASAVYLIDNGRLRLVAAGHPDSAVQRSLERARVAGELPSHALDDDVPPCNAVRTGHAVLIPELAPEVSDALTSGVTVQRSDGTFGRRPLRSYLAVPMIGADGPIGVLAFGYSFSGRTYRPDDVPVALELARRVTPAVMNAKRYEGDREVIEVLQRTLLPAALPDVPGLSITGRYLPGGAGLRIGGDWYDALVLGDGRLFVAIGDVVGHGVRAAASMGRLRNALQIYAVEHRSPAAMLRELNRHYSSFADADMATIGVLVHDPDTGRAQFASAGHPPPVVRAPDGRVRFLEPARGMPVCATLGAEYEETDVAFPPGSTLVLYTDGLVERRGESLDAGLQRLANAVLTGPRDADALADHLLAALLAHDAPTDDVALLIVHFDQDRSRFSACLHADPRDLAQLRRSFSDWLITAGADEDTRADVVLAVNEAVANAMEHAYGPVDAMVEVTGLARDPGVFEVWVRDFGHWRADRPHAGGGRGLILMRNLMDTVTVDNSEHGTTVHLTRARRNAATATGDGVEQPIR